MLKIQCPKCNKSFLWTDEMPMQGKCMTPDCEWYYDIYKELGRNISHHEHKMESRTPHCPFCQGEIASKFTICSKCSRVVLGNKAFRKSYIFVAVCLILILLSYVINYWMK
jgi:hypothetical protein